MSAEKFSSFLKGHLTASDLRLLVGIERKKILGITTFRPTTDSDLNFELYVNPIDIDNVLRKFLNDEWNAHLLQDWASFILLEGNEIFQSPCADSLDEDYYEDMWYIIQQLSSPEIDGSITKKTVGQHLNLLRKKFTIKVGENDLRFMLEKFNLLKKIKTNIEISLNSDTRLYFETCETLRDLCGEKLQTEGFDEDYNLNKLGKTLNRLVDKLLVNRACKTNCVTA